MSPGGPIRFWPLGGALLLAACFSTEAPRPPENPALFKTGLYAGKSPVYDLSVGHYTYFHANGAYEFYEYKQLEDKDSLVCYRQTRGAYSDSGDTIAFTGLEIRDRAIDSLKTVGNPWSEWRERNDFASAKQALYKSYGHDFFVTTDYGGDSKGNYWSENVRSEWIGKENAALPFPKE